MMPGAMHSMDVVMVNPGLSVVQCRVADHILAGAGQGGGRLRTQAPSSSAQHSLTGMLQRPSLDWSDTHTNAAAVLPRTAPYCRHAGPHHR